MRYTPGSQVNGTTDGRDSVQYVFDLGGGQTTVVGNDGELYVWTYGDEGFMLIPAADIDGVDWIEEY